MNWTQILQDKSLHDLPYKIETNQFGQIVMSPASNRHSIFQGRIILQLGKLAHAGEIMPECAIQTTDGVKVADVAWASPVFIERYGEQLAYEAAPELCVEVLSPSNHKLEIDSKQALYFEQGAREVWICDDNGRIRFLGRKGKLERSEQFPAFPSQV